MVTMSSVDAEIDNLYKAPLQEFVQLRAALAKRLTGADAQRVKALPKPTLVPWAVNQLYWWARPGDDRLTKSGAKLRAVQIAGLEGRRGRRTTGHRDSSSGTGRSRQAGHVIGGESRRSTESRCLDTNARSAVAHNRRWWRSRTLDKAAAASWIRSAHRCRPAYPVTGPFGTRDHAPLVRIIRSERQGPQAGTPRGCRRTPTG